MSEASRVEELTLKVLDGAASDDEIGELQRLVAPAARGNERAREVHIALVEQEAILRGGRRELDLVEATLERVRRTVGERVEQGVMKRIRGRKPAQREGGVPVSQEIPCKPTEPEWRWLGSRRFWLSSAAAVTLLAAAVGLHAWHVSSRHAEARSKRGEKSPGASPLKTSACAGGLVPLELELPKPAFTGTPKNVPPGVRMKKPTDKPRPPFMAPAGVKNVAFEKMVSASDEEPIIGEIDMITDGDKEAKDGSYVELGPGLQWVQIDLEAEYEIFVVLFWYYHGDPRVYHDVVVQFAEDPDFITGVKTIFNNDHDNSAGLGIGKEYEYFELFEGNLVDAGGVKSRYIRLYSNGSTADDMNRFTEVEVYGRPAK